MATSLMNVFFFDLKTHHRSIQRVKKNGAQHEGFFSHGLGCEAKHDRHGVQDNASLRRRFVLPTWCQGNSGRKRCFIDYKMANASLVRPRQRPKRQNEAKTTTQLLWRARMLKLRRAGMVSTKRLLAFLFFVSLLHLFVLSSTLFF